MIWVEESLKEGAVNISTITAILVKSPPEYMLWAQISAQKLCSDVFGDNVFAMQDATDAR